MDFSFGVNPLRIKSPIGWVGHIPFAFWIINKLRPGCFVELGTHTGNSYFAFCQGVHAHHLPTRCYAVDTWDGDEHAGQYGEEVYADVAQYNSQHYASFSVLMRMTFDNAVDYFGGKSIDLLHIDGLHTYDAVSHDFETWLPKISDRGIVLFHDINVRERGFGVWRFWEEVSARYPHIAFDHSHGLGVLFVGTDVNSELLALLDEYESENGRHRIKFLFSGLGSYMEMQYQLQDADRTQDELREENSRLEQEGSAYRAEVERLSKTLEELRENRSQLERATMQQQVGDFQKSLARMERSSSWRMTKPIRKWTKSVRKRSRKLRCFFSPNSNNFLKEGAEVTRQNNVSENLGEERSYQKWVEKYDALSEEKKISIANEVALMDDPPLISVIMPVYNPSVAFLKAAIESVRNQLYSNWELCIADDKSPDKSIRKVLRTYAKSDPRIRCIFRESNGHISQASNSALGLAKGEYIALLDHDDELHSAALYYAAKEILAYPDAGIIYSDEDKIDEEGKRRDPYFKSDFNYDLFLCQNMISHLGLYKRALVVEIGGFRTGMEGSQDYDLALRVLEKIKENQVRHIPKILYHWRIHNDSTARSSDAKPYAIRRSLQAVNEHFARTGKNAEAVNAPNVESFHKVIYNLPVSLPLVDIIIPTRDKPRLIRNCVESILAKTDYPNYRITIIDNGSVESETLGLLKSWENRYQNVGIITDGGPFNYSRLNNYAVSASKAEYVCLMNNDIEVISEGWLGEMVSHGMQSNVGAVGARLWYPNNKLQHGGVILGVGGVANHAHLNIDRLNPGYFGKACIQQSISAVTGACVLLSRKKFLEVGGLNEECLPIAFNDVDLCLKLLVRGYRNIWTPYAELYHHESASRGKDTTPEQRLRFENEVNYMIKTWGTLLENDPFYNPNLSRSDTSFNLAWPPRVE